MRPSSLKPSAANMTSMMSAMKATSMKKARHQAGLLLSDESACYLAALFMSWSETSMKAE